MKNKKIAITAICIILLIFLVLIILLNNNHSGDKFSAMAKKDIKQDVNIINEIKNEINATADANMYQIEEEYDGRKIIQIKPNIQYDTVLSGIIKNAMPKENEIYEILKNRPNRSGIWISNQSKEKFLRLLKENDIDNFEIDNEGYLYAKEITSKEISKKIVKAINSKKLYILDISGKYYTRDELSGKIIQYPFEDMESDQILETYSSDNSLIIEITTNSRKILSNKEILEDILLNLEN